MFLAFCTLAFKKLLSVKPEEESQKEKLMGTCIKVNEKEVTTAQEFLKKENEFALQNSDIMLIKM